MMGSHKRKGGLPNCHSIVSLFAKQTKKNNRESFQSDTDGEGAESQPNVTACTSSTKSQCEATSSEAHNEDKQTDKGLIKIDEGAETTDSMLRPTVIRHGKHCSKFNEDWKRSRNWLIYNREKHGMFCDLCTKFQASLPIEKEVWIKIPCTRIRHESVADHEKSAMHKLAERLQRETKTCESVAAELLPQIQARDLTNAFACLYYPCKQKIAHTTNFEALLDLATFLGVEVKKNLAIAKNAVYLSRHAINEMIASISHVIEADLLKRLSSSPYYSIEMDEASDCSVSEQLIIHGRYIEEDGKLRSCYLKVINLLDFKSSQEAMNSPGSLNITVNIEYSTIVK